MVAADHSLVLLGPMERVRKLKVGGPITVVLAMVWASHAAAQPAEEDLVNTPATETLDAQTLLVQVLTELTVLRQSVERLQETVDILVQNAVAASPEGSVGLRDYAYDELPAPISESAGEAVTEEEAQPRPQETQIQAGSVSYSVIKEWGRSPEMVAQLGGKISTLKGMVLLVPQHSTDDDLIQMGKELRAQFADYDNINIEIFNDRESAMRFANEGVADDAERRVMTISKFEDSGRDLILLVNGDSTTTVLP